MKVNVKVVGVTFVRYVLPNTQLTEDSGGSAHFV